MVLLLGVVAMLLLGAVAFVVPDFGDFRSCDSFSCAQLLRDLSGGLPRRISGATLGVLDIIVEEL